MRLINAETLGLEDFTLREIPPYAILSHTWADEEVTFQDVTAGHPGLASKKGYGKVVQTCRLALQQGLAYAWVDTCCIDKSSSAELTESINSMYGYYQRSAFCFALLSDSPSDSLDISSSRWFTRGWTLQELIAPPRLQFYHQDWSHYADKSQISDMLSDITRIPCDVLADSSRCYTLSVATRMSWAADRHTTRLEDNAYSLLGIFDINMPLIYGEGRKAFIRLQEEIVKRVNDLTIFAWEPSSEQSADEVHSSLLASSPMVFRRGLILDTPVDQSPEFSVTNKGLLVSAETPLGQFTFSNQESCLGICLGYAPGKGGVHSGRVFLRLQKIGPNLFRTSERHRLMWFNAERWAIRWLGNHSSYHIVMDSRRAQTTWDMFRRHGIILPRGPEYTRVNWATPDDLWDPDTQIFLRPKPYVGSFFPMVLAISIDIQLAGGIAPLIIVCENISGKPSVGTISDRVSQANFISIMVDHREKSIPWTQLADSDVKVRWSMNRPLAFDPGAYRRSVRGHSIIVDRGAAGVTDVHQVAVYLDEINDDLLSALKGAC